jgi:oligosaccharyltransferase complex subunit beta
LKEGIYQFKVSYRKPGWTFLVESERVTVRPYKHDEYERFLLVAYPYQFGLCGTIASTFIFMVVYLYTSTTDVKKMKED